MLRLTGTGLFLLACRGCGRVGPFEDPAYMCEEDWESLRGDPNKWLCQDCMTCEGCGEHCSSRACRCPESCHEVKDDDFW